MNGKLVKLMVIACSDPEYRQETGDVYQALINPSEYREHVEVDYCATAAFGASHAALKYRGTRPQEIAFSFHFDGTGALPVPAGKTLRPVPNQIEEFRKVALNYDGEIHSPRYLKILWGTLEFKGRLVDLDITYTLFQPDGLPLRAKAEAKFRGSITPQQRLLQERRSSPDLTHVRIVKAGDNLPNLSHEIYGDPSHYLAVARANNLTSFRKLTPGQRLIFPPLETPKP